MEKPLALLDFATPDIKTSYCIDLDTRDRQVAENIKRISGRVQPHSDREDRIAVVCYGPSLEETWPQLREFDKIITVSGAHKFLIDRGIIPTWHAEVDPRPHKADLIGIPHKQVEYLAASVCHSAVFDLLEGFNVKLWHVFAHEAMREGVPVAYARGDWAITGGSNVGLRAMVLARFLGFTKMTIFGMDYSFKSDGTQHAGWHPKEVPNIYAVEVAGRYYYTNPPMHQYAQQFFDEVSKLGKVDIDVVGEGLLQAQIREHIKTKPLIPPNAKPAMIAATLPPTITSEYAELNRKLHASDPSYGISGSKRAEVIRKLIETTKPTTILDYGCGKGSLGAALDRPIWEYDPCVPGKDAPPRPADLVVCFPAGTVIGGSTAMIEQLNNGDRVGGNSGVEQAVTQTFRNSYSGEMVTLRVATVPDLEMTANHPILVSKVRRVHRKNNQYHRKSSYEYVVDGAAWKHAKDVQRGDWVSVPRIVGEKIPTIGFRIHGNSKREETKAVDERIAWLLGLYVAEGFTSYPKGFGGRLALCLSRDEEELAEKAVAVFGEMGVHASIHRPTVDRGVLLVYASCVGLCRVVDEWCGKGAANKIVPEAIKFSPESIIRAFISGLVDGDGCVRTSCGRRYYSISTVSKRLAYGVIELLLKIGVHAYLPNPSQRRRGFIRGRSVPLRPAYVPSWSERSWLNVANKDGKIPYGEGKFIGTKVYLPVRGIDRRMVEKLPVFNIETADHTYGVPYTVHNCTDVLEHVEPECLEAVLLDISRCTLKVCYTVINTGPAIKVLADGRNAHLIQQPLEWWKEQLAAYFSVASIVQNGVEVTAVLGPKPKHEKKEPPPLDYSQRITPVRYKGTEVKFHAPNTHTQWRAQSLPTKEPATMEWIDTFNAGEILYDVGANVGGYSVWAAKRRGVKVLAFEPQAENYAMLCRNLILNQAEATAYCMAMTDTPKLSRLWLSSTEVGSAVHTFNAPVGPDLKERKGIPQGCVGFTLDMIAEKLGAPDHIKIDVDGMEHLVIAGAKNLLEQGKIKSLLVEVNGNLKEHQAMVQYLQGIGFEFDPQQVERATRKEGNFKGCAEYVFQRRAHALIAPVDFTQAVIHLEPFKWLFMENVFSIYDYAEIRGNLPNDYRPIAETRGVNGYAQRFTASPTDPFWTIFFARLRNGQLKRQLCKIFGVDNPESLKDECLLVRDLAGYHIGPHTDSPQKVITVLFYLPPNELLIEAGTSIYEPLKPGFTCEGGPHYPAEDFRIVQTMPFKPNSAFAFLKSNNSFHGVEPCEGTRDVLLYDIRV